MRAFLVTLLLLIACAGRADAQERPQGPSFDCARARTPIERSICGRPMLASLDRRLAELVAAAPRTPDALAEQRAWLSRRDACARSQTLDWLAACVEAAYRDRIAKLEFGAQPAELAGAEPPSGPSFDCSRAQGPIEGAICADPALSSLDLALAASFARRSREPGAAADQKRWMDERDGCMRFPPTMVACVAAAYERRLDALR